jgi:pimeloyl-ACP methyl ester carboxylesterase
MEVTVDGAPVFLADHGRGVEPKPPTILFVHGAGMDHSVWSLQTRHFAYRGWNALAADLPGHGRSGAEPCPSIAALAEWLWSLIRVLDAPVVTLVGHSMGALIGLELAARRRKRVASLALLGAAARMPVHPDLLAAAAGPGPRAAELICDWGFGPAGHLGGHKAPGSWMMGHARRLLEGSVGPVLQTDLAACAAYEDGLAAAAQVRCPTLILAGGLDRMAPARQGARLAEAIKGARFVAVPLAGHMLMIEQPDATLDALVDFVHLAGQAARAG